MNGATPEHIAQIAAARARGKKIRRAIVVSALSGWTTLVFAVFTILFSFSSFTGMVLGIGMCIVSIIEFKG
ncbi:MAG TPA: hypothetical protein VH518_04270, partial [Tepidisphaeraceae bacterium]